MEPGERVGRYVIEALLGVGGMGEVYRAYDEVLRRRVAIKLLRTDVGDPSDGASSVRRVLREARMAASLEHPNVVAIHDVGEHGETSFIVMELIKGRSLRSLVGADVPVTERLRWLFDAARALAAAHRAGLIHRDIKPENVLLRDDGVVKVLDFGIARETSAVIARASAARVPIDRSPVAWTGGLREGESAIAGTPAYMAPEQVRGQELDARVDQFAWGVTAYELLAGRLPWTADASTLLDAVLHQAPPPLDAASLGVAPAVALSVARAMRKARDERFASMDELLVSMGASTGADTSQNIGALASLQPSSPELASAPTEFASAPTELATRSAGSLAVPRQDSSGRAATTRVRTVGLLAAILVLAGAGAMWAARRHEPVVAFPPIATPSASSAAAPLAFRPVEAKRLTFDLACEEFPVLTPDARTVVFSASIDDFEQLVAIDLASGARRVLTSGPGRKMAPSLSPDGTRVAYLDRRSDARGVYVMPLDGSTPPHLVRGGGLVRPLWSLDGQAVWVSDNAGAARVEVDGGRVTREIVAPPASELTRVQELPDGSAVALAVAQNHLSTLGLFSYAPGSSSPTPLVEADVEETLAITHDGAQLLFSKILPTGQVELWHVPSRGGVAASVGDSSIQPTKGLTIVGERIVWSTCRTQQTLSALRSTPGKPRELHAEQLAPPSEWEDVGGATVFSDPTALAILSTRSGKRQPWIIDLSGAKPARTIPTGDLDIQNLTVSPDGRWIAFIVGGRGVFVEPADASAPPHAVTAKADDTNPAFASDNRTLYFETNGPSGRRAIGAVSIEGDVSQPVRIVLEGALGPSASPVDGRLLYLESSGRGSEGLPRVLDTATGRSRRLSASLGSGDHPGSAWSPDGARIAVTNGLQEIVEVDAARGNVLRHYRSGDALLDGMAYVGPDLVVVLGSWSGDVWTARDASVSP